MERVWSCFSHFPLSRDSTLMQAHKINPNQPYFSFHSDTSRRRVTRRRGSQKTCKGWIYGKMILNTFRCRWNGGKRKAKQLKAQHDAHTIFANYRRETCAAYQVGDYRVGVRVWQGADRTAVQQHQCVGAGGRALVLMGNLPNEDFVHGA